MASVYFTALTPVRFLAGRRGLPFPRPLGEGQGGGPTQVFPPRLALTPTLSRRERGLRNLSLVHRAGQEDLQDSDAHPADLSSLDQM
jgi:hypothetical protein